MVRDPRHCIQGTDLGDVFRKNSMENRIPR